MNQLGPVLAQVLARPFAFFGHSMGAILAFEMTRWLRRNGGPTPKCLFVSGRRAPQIPDTDPPLHLLNDRDFLAEIRGLNATPDEVLANPDLLELVLPTVRADVELCETYEYVDDARLACPIIAFAGINDQDETLERMKEWSLQTTADFWLRALPDDHFFIHSSERQLLELLRIELARR
jgi:surfactin synthase thioesterase subunit